ncbi:MAG: hypothetical protein K2O30_09465 [Duncaniella sp.]|nr:hypothetical protein [Duncaniella sp.]
MNRNILSITLINTLEKVMSCQKESNKYSWLDKQSTYLSLCQDIVDTMIGKDIHELEYGKPLGVFKAQHISAVIEELRNLDAVKRIEGTNIFKATPAIYRLYYGRYFDRLKNKDKSERQLFWVNIGLAIISLASAVFAGFSAANCRNDVYIYQPPAVHYKGEKGEENKAAKDDNRVPSSYYRVFDTRQ